MCNPTPSPTSPALLLTSQTRLFSSLPNPTPLATSLAVFIFGPPNPSSLLFCQLCHLFSAMYSSRQMSSETTKGKKIIYLACRRISLKQHFKELSCRLKLFVCLFVFKSATSPTFEYRYLVILITDNKKKKAKMSDHKWEDSAVVFNSLCICVMKKQHSESLPCSPYLDSLASDHSALRSVLR